MGHRLGLRPVLLSDSDDPARLGPGYPVFLANMPGHRVWLKPDGFHVEVFIWDRGGSM